MPIYVQFKKEFSFFFKKEFSYNLGCQSSNRLGRLPCNVGIMSHYGVGAGTRRPSGRDVEEVILVTFISEI